MSIFIHVKRKIWSLPCVICSLRRDIHVDHIIPTSLGGTDDETNLQPLCWQCNLRKSNRRSNDELLELFQANKSDHVTRSKLYSSFCSARKDKFRKSIFYKAARSEMARRRAIKGWKTRNARRDWKRKQREVLRIIAATLCLTLSGCESFVRLVNNQKRPNPYKPQIHQASEYK